MIEGDDMGKVDFGAARGLLRNVVFLVWLAAVLALVARVDAQRSCQECSGADDGTPRGSEWGAVSFEALCRAGMPSAACLEDDVGNSDSRDHAPPPARSVQESQASQHEKKQPSILSTKHPPSTSPPAHYTIAVPGHRQVLDSTTLKVIVMASGAPLPSTSAFQIVVEGRTANEQPAGAQGEHSQLADKWIDSRSWLLSNMDEHQRPGKHTEAFSYIFLFDISSAADGPLEISLLFHPGEEEDDDEVDDVPWTGEEGDDMLNVRHITRLRRRAAMIQGSYPGRCRSAPPPFHPSLPPSSLLYAHPLPLPLPLPFPHSDLPLALTHGVY